MPAASAALASGMSITGLGIHSGVGRARSFALASAICSNSALLGSRALERDGRLSRPAMPMAAGLSAADAVRKCRPATTPTRTKRLKIQKTLCRGLRIGNNRIMETSKVLR